MKRWQHNNKYVQQSCANGGVIVGKTRKKTTEQVTAVAVPKTGVKGFFKKLYKYRAFLIMLLPAVIYTLIFAYYPMTGIVLAFK